MNLDIIAGKCAELMDTKVQEVFNEEIESDAGFMLKNGYGLQIAPYMDNFYLIYSWNDEGNTYITETRSITKVYDTFLNIYENGGASC